MNLNYAIFRSEPIYTINDLAQIGSHNKRENTLYENEFKVLEYNSKLDEKNQKLTKRINDILKAI